jgi:hypothetical protein
MPKPLKVYHSDATGIDIIFPKKCVNNYIRKYFIENTLPFFSQHESTPVPCSHTSSQFNFPGNLGIWF